MKKTTLLLASILMLASPAMAGKWTQWVNPFHGTDKQDGLQGNTYPGATTPFGMVQLSPDTYDEPSWDSGSGYTYDQNKIYGFSHTRLSGTGANDFIDITLMPMITDKEYKPVYTFSHDQESARPGYYQVMLQDNGINVELSATTHTGIHRYTYPAGKPRYVFLDLDHSADKGSWSRTILKGQIRKVSDRVIEGYRVITGWAKMRKIYFRIEFSEPMEEVQFYSDGKRFKETPLINGDDLRSIAKFKTTDKNTLMAKVSLSAVDIEGARKNMAAEATSWDLDKYVADADAAWDKLLGTIEVEGNEHDMRTFYSSFYHTLIQPNAVSDVDGRYIAADYSVKKMPAGKTFYSTFSLWDTYRAAHPLYQLLFPDYNRSFVESMFLHYDVYGYLPIWQLWGEENYCMIGNHAIPVVVDAALRGDVDKERAYDAVKQSSMRSHKNSPFDVWDKYGYMPEDLQTQSVSITLEMAYDDWCVSQLAKALGHDEDAAYFAKRSQNYRNIYNSANGFFQARMSDGSWLEPFNPLQYGANGGNPFTEGNAWQWKWYVPQDIKGMIAIFGGAKATENQLDKFFTTKDESEDKNNNASGFVGQYVQGNEPDHHVPFLYNNVGKPRKTQELVNHILTTLYNDTPAGISGNDDCGEMSAWYMFSALGFYPVSPASGEYEITTPLFRKAVLHLPNGKNFTITTDRKDNSQCFIKSMRLNGKAKKDYTLSYSDIINGGEWSVKCTK